MVYTCRMVCVCVWFTNTDCFPMKQTKHVLVGEVVRVMGLQRSLDIFEKTVVIQETGGRMTATGDKK